MFPEDHPSITGHFPGAPVAPGALLLAWVDQMIDEYTSGEGYMLRSVKFLRPVQPGESLSVSWKKGITGDLSFLCEIQGEPALSGVFAICNAQSGQSHA